MAIVNGRHMKTKTRKKQGSRTAKPSLSRKEWFDQALRILQDEGIAGVRVERLARDLGVTKGSFYWHFVDRADLLNSLLEYWSDEFTGVIADNPEFQGGDPTQRLYRIMEAIDELTLARFDLAIRSWAKHDPRSAAQVRKVYRTRLDFIRNVFAEIGFRGDELKMRTRTFVIYFSWQQTMKPLPSLSERRRMRKLQHKMLTKK